MNTCPKCYSSNIAEFFYGMPAMDEELRKKIDDKKVILGGCLVNDNNPDYKCYKCNYEWNKLAEPSDETCKICGDIIMYCDCYKYAIKDED